MIYDTSSNFSSVDMMNNKSITDCFDDEIMIDDLLKLLESEPDNKSIS